MNTGVNTNEFFIIDNQPKAKFINQNPFLNKEINMKKVGKFVTTRESSCGYSYPGDLTSDTVEDAIDVAKRLSQNKDVVYIYQLIKIAKPETPPVIIEDVE